MTNENCMPNGLVLVAIDISKHRHEVLIERPGIKRRSRITLTNSRADIERLIAQLRCLGTEVKVAFEATGNYHRVIAHHLLSAGFKMNLVSSVALARTREALQNGWDKNDPKDAQVILHMLKIGAVQHYADPLYDQINDLQELSKTHDCVSRAKTELWHRIVTHYLPLYFPEIERFAGNSRSDWFLALLERFPTPGSIVALGREGFIKEAWPIIGRKVEKTRLLNDVFETALSSAALPVGEETAAIAMFRMVIAEARSLIRQRDQIEQMAHELLKNHKDYQLLRQIPGIGPINALTILAEAGDLRRFRHHRQFLKYCGLDLSTYQSGTFRSQTKLSKFGNARLRRTLWLAAQVAMRQKENSFRDKLSRYIARDRDSKDLRRKAITALTAKMARVVHAVIKSGTEYRPFFERPIPSGGTSLCRCREGTDVRVSATL